MTFEPGTVQEFFAGVGLARMGLERAGWRVVFSNDIDPKKRVMHEGHWGWDPQYVVKDVFELEPDDVPPAELAWASFPCVDLSLAGNRAGLDGGASKAYWGFYRQLERQCRDSRPGIVVIENVPGMLSSHGGQDLATIVAGLNTLGYVVNVLMIDAARFVPQSRPRLFVVASRNPGAMVNGVPTQPSAHHPPSVLAFMAAHSELCWGHTLVADAPVRSTTFGEVVERFPEGADI